MVFDPLILDPTPESLWTDFQAGKRLPAEVPPVVARWRRSRDLGAHYDGPRPEDALYRGDDLMRHAERVGPLLACGQSVLQRIARAAADHDYALLVSDTDGVIVRADGGGDFADYARSVRLLEGADWSEATRGTNAIGTALAEGRPVFVRGDAHFARAYHQLVCYAAPIRDASGELIAILDATSSVQRSDAAMGLGVIAAAQALEELVRMRAYSLAGATVTRALARSLERMNCPVAVIEPPGRIARVNAPARELLGGASSSRSTHELLGYDFEQLAALARSGDALEIEAPATGQAHQLRLEPIDSDGRLIAVLTFFEPATIPRSQRQRPAATVPVARTVRPLRATQPPAPFRDLFADDPATRAALERAARVAPSDVPIILLAETGAGKELVARGIHRASGRADGPFVAINCGSVAPTLLESELFGYGPGAFTGAEKRGRDGYLAAAAGGTLFLDEVAEMSLAMQAALLRFLENGTYHRVGEVRELHADVRVLCATCRDLRTMVADGTFRDDLYYRLKGATVMLPPLRARTDVIPLARHLLRDIAARRDVVPAPTLSAQVESFFASFAWPGNVRELKSTLEVAMVMAAPATTIELDHLPGDMMDSAPLSAPATAAPVPSLDEVQSRVISKVLSEVAGNVSLAARRLGVARSTLYRMMRRYGLAPSKH